MKRLIVIQFILILVSLMGLNLTAWAHTNILPQDAKDLIDANDQLLALRELNEAQKKKQRRTNKKPEAKVQKQILDYLAMRPGCELQRTNSGKVKVGNYWVSLGEWLDISGYLIVNGVAIHTEIEVKAPGKKPTKKQQARR